MVRVMPYLASVVGSQLTAEGPKPKVARMQLGLLLRYLHGLRLTDRCARKYSWDQRELKDLARVEKMVTRCMETCLEYNQRLVRVPLGSLASIASQRPWG